MSAWARAARGQLEDVLHATGWIYSRRLSLWVDALVILEDAAP